MGSQLTAIVLEIDRTPGNNVLTLGVPDACGLNVPWPFDDDDEAMLRLKPGTQVSLAMTPLIPARGPYASDATPNTAGLVPADHRRSSGETGCATPFDIPPTSGQ
jgi:hypothetical protein